MKKLSMFLVMLCWSGVVFGEGYLNVVTGIKSAVISIDGKKVGKDYVQRYPLSEGDHYVRVVHDGYLMYAKMVTITDGELTTITSEHFVDIKTNVANRGAINREARRLSETKGNVALGVMAGTGFPASGASVKWFVLPGLGVQISGIAGFNSGDYEHRQAGARIIKNLGNKILGNTLFNGFATVGYARIDKDHREDTADTSSSDNFGVSIGAEFSFADPLYFSFELGSTYNVDDNDETSFGFSVAGGMHFYF